MQVMPGALLEMTRAVMRQAFAVITPKAVYTFDFNRRSVIDASLLKSLQIAQETGSVVCATPQAVKVRVQLDLYEFSQARCYLAQWGAPQGCGAVSLVCVAARTRSLFPRAERRACSHGRVLGSAR